MLGRLSLAAAEIAKKEGIADVRLSHGDQHERDAGQTVFHVHLHLLGGRAMAWPPG